MVEEEEEKKKLSFKRLYIFSFCQYPCKSLGRKIPPFRLLFVFFLLFMKSTGPCSAVNRPPRFPRPPPRIHPWFGLWTRRGTEGKPGVLGKTGRRWGTWPRDPRPAAPQCHPCWRAFGGSGEGFSLVTPRPLSSPPGPSWAWLSGSETRWWPARWRDPAVAQSGRGRPEKGTSGTKTSSPIRKSGGSWKPSATFSSSSTSASVRRRLDALDLGGVGEKKEEWNKSKGHFPPCNSSRGHTAKSRPARRHQLLFAFLKKMQFETRFHWISD